MDTFFSYTPADGIPGHAGCMMMQLFLGLRSGLVSGYPMLSETQVPEALEDHLCKVGSPSGIRSDQANAQPHGPTKDLLRMYNIDDSQSEAEYLHQNPAERGVEDVKRHMNNIMFLCSIIG